MDDSRSPLLDRLLAYEEIRQLVARYAVATDSRDLDALVALFVDDVRVGADLRGRAALRAFFDRSLRAVGITILDVGTHVIDFDDEDHASGIVYCRGEIQVGDRWVVQAIQYRDRYERRGGHWYFVRRRHLLWYGREVGTSPLGLPPARWPEHHTGSGELPHEWPTWGAFWAAASDEQRSASSPAGSAGSAGSDEWAGSDEGPGPAEVPGPAEWPGPEEWPGPDEVPGPAEAPTSAELPGSAEPFESPA